MRFRPALLVPALLVTALSACSPAEHADTPAPAISAALTAAVPDHLSIGVVTSLTSAPDEGAQWREAAEGARVAANRFALGGATVTLIAVNDKGTSAGAEAAVQSLADAGVAGIVLATSGDHLAKAVADAAADKLPVLLPYEPSADGLPADAWLTGPDTATTSERLVGALRDRGLTKPVLLDAGGGSIDGLSPTYTETYEAGDDASALATKLATRQKKPATSFDAVVISGPAQYQGVLVSALQGAAVNVPTVLSPDALSPAFAQSVTTAGGSLSGTFVSAGLDNGDSRALEPTPAGRALAAYFSALGLTAGNSSITDLSGDEPFSSVAASADVRSHDAVVALVRAAEKAHSVDPAAVGDALGGMKLGLSDGLAGPSLDFSTATAVNPDDVIALMATPVSPGVRPTVSATSSGSGTGSDDGALFWYPATPA